MDPKELVCFQGACAVEKGVHQVNSSRYTWRRYYRWWDLRGVYTLVIQYNDNFISINRCDKINAIRPYIVALDSYNAYSVAYANQLQPTLEELRNGSHNTTITLPKYKDLKTALEAAKQDSPTPYEDVNQSTNDVLAVLDQLIPVADQLQAYYVERRFEKDNFKGSDELAAQYVPLAEHSTLHTTL